MNDRIHLVPGPALAVYQRKRRYNLRMLVPMMRLDAWLAPRGITVLGDHPPVGAWGAFHGFRPGLIALDQARADAIRAGVADPELVGLGWTDDAPVDLDGVVLRALIDWGALQNPWELAQFLARIAARRPRVIVEIGTSAGGLLYALGQVADPTATLVSIDVPEARDPPDLDRAVTAILPGLVRRSQTLHLIRSPSRYHDTRAQLRRLLDGRAVDLLIIDGDHSYGGVRADFEMYADVVGRGGLIALHDVAVLPGNSGPGFDVGHYWAELRAARPTETILDPDGVPGLLGQVDAAPAARRPVAFGFGLIEVG